MKFPIPELKICVDNVELTAKFDSLIIKAQVLVTALWIICGGGEWKIGRKGSG